MSTLQELVPNKSAPDPLLIERSVRAAVLGGFSNDIPDYLEGLPDGGTHPRRVLHMTYRALHRLSETPGVEERHQEFKHVGRGVGRLMARYAINGKEGADGIRDVDISSFLFNLPFSIRTSVHKGVSDSYTSYDIANNPLPSLQPAIERSDTASMFAVTEAAPVRAAKDVTGTMNIFDDPEVAQSFADDIAEVPHTVIRNDVETTDETGIDNMFMKAVEAARTADDLQELINIGLDTNITLGDYFFTKVKTLMTVPGTSIISIERLSEFRYRTDDPLIQSEIAILRDRNLVKLGQVLFLKGELGMVKQLIENTVLYSTEKEFFEIFRSLYAASCAEQ